MQLASRRTFFVPTRIVVAICLGRNFQGQAEGNHYECQAKENNSLVTLLMNCRA
jgi:hypothetical protein